MHASLATGEMLRILSYLDDCSNELENAVELRDPNPVFRMPCT
jgi:multiple sugar transport system substrate-binding protein